MTLRGIICHPGYIDSVSSFMNLNRGNFFCLFSRYAKFLVNYPSVILGITILVVIMSAVLGMVPSTGAKDYPDFSEPDKVSIVMSRNFSCFSPDPCKETEENLSVPKFPRQFSATL